MKFRTLIAVCVLMLAAAVRPCAAQDPVSPDDAAFDAIPEGGVTQDYVADLLLKLSDIRQPLVKGDVFTDPDKKSQIAEFLTISHSITNILLDIASGNVKISGTPEEVQKVKDYSATYKRYYYDSRMQEILEYVLTVINSNSAVKRRMALTESVDWFDKNEKIYINDFVAFNKRALRLKEGINRVASGQRINGIPSLPRPRPSFQLWIYTLPVVIKGTELDAYIDPATVRLRPAFAGEVRILDSHIAAVSDAKLKDHEPIFDSIKVRGRHLINTLNDAIAMTKNDRGYDVTALLCVSDAKIFQNIYDLGLAGLSGIEYFRNYSPLRVGDDSIGAEYLFTFGSSYSEQIGPWYYGKLKDYIDDLVSSWNKAVKKFDDEYGRYNDWIEMQFKR
ncbi:MAG: hypothetical protein ACI4NN_04835 [Pyramidobacter sp.]